MIDPLEIKMVTDKNLSQPHKSNPDKIVVLTQLSDLSEQQPQNYQRENAITIQKNTLLQVFMGHKQKPDEVPDEKVSFFCANEKCCKLCRPLGDTL